MTFNIVAKLLVALCLCSIAVNGLDGSTNEYVNEDRISRLSNHVENLKNLLDLSPSYNNKNYNYRYQSSWPNIYNRESAYDVYLRQYYIEPILDSFKEILEHVNNIPAANNNPQPFYGQSAGQSGTSFGSSHGKVKGWGESQSLYSQSHSFSGDSSHALSFPLNENMNGNSTTTLWNIKDRFPPFVTEPHKFESGYIGNKGSAHSQTAGSGSVSNLPTYTQSNRFGDDLASNLPSYDQSHKFGFGNAPSNTQFYNGGNKYAPFIPSIRPPIYDSHSIYPRPSSPSISNRYPEEEDTGTNWGLVEEKDDDTDDIRPISLKPKTSAQPNCNCEACYDKMPKSSPIQLSKTLPKTALTCKAVVLSCCRPGIMEEQRRDCFASQGCVRSYDTGLACLPVVIRAVYKELYENLH